MYLLQSNENLCPKDCTWIHAPAHLNNYILNMSHYICICVLLAVCVIFQVSISLRDDAPPPWSHPLLPLPHQHHTLTTHPSQLHVPHTCTHLPLTYPSGPVEVCHCGGSYQDPRGRTRNWPDDVDSCHSLSTFGTIPGYRLSAIQWVSIS